MLRGSGTRALLVGLVTIAASSGMTGTGCSATKPTELVPGALSQIRVPDDLAGIKVQVFSNGAQKFSQHALVTNGVALLPATLGVTASGSASTTVTVLVAGYDKTGIEAPSFGDDTQPIGEVDSMGGPRVRRGSVQTFVDQHILWLPMPLSFSCYDIPCGTDDTQTCKASQCGTSSTDSKTLVDFDPSLVDGSQDCFNPATCFDPTVTALVVNADECIYEVPPGEATGPGLNVRVVYQPRQLVKDPTSSTGYDDHSIPSSEEEILNIEPNDPTAGLPKEGFAIPDPSNKYQFQLSPGLCNLVKQSANPPKKPPPSANQTNFNYNTIGAVQVSTTCPSKPPLLPICPAEQNPVTQSADGGQSTSVVCNQPVTLLPAPSAVYLVMDDSQIMHGAYGPDGYATAMGLSLNNPVFKRTYVAFEFLDHKPGDCTATMTQYTTPGLGSVPHSIDFEVATQAQLDIAPFLGTWSPPDPGGPPFSPLYLEAAMRVDVGAYKHLLDFEKSVGEPLQVAAVMFFLNRQPDSLVLDGGGVDAGAMVPTGVDCDPALDTNLDNNATTAIEQEIAAAAGMGPAGGAGLQTYFVVLDNSLSGVGTPLQYFENIQSDLKTTVPTMQVIDATQQNDVAAAVTNFAGIVTALGTCLYELPPGVDTNATVDFTLPIQTSLSQCKAPVPVKVPRDPACNAMTQTTGANGWNIDGTHIRLCGSFCSNLRESVEVVTATSKGLVDGGCPSPADAGTTNIPEVPVTATMPCVDGGT